jgi:hypothetical protein
MKKYDIIKLIPSALCERQDKQLENQIIRREIEKGRKLFEGYNSDIEGMLWKYSFIIRGTAPYYS